MSLRLGCDVGGTFTDFVLHDAATGAIETLKLPTDPAAPDRAVLEGLRRLAADRPGLIAGLEALIHGTTLVINAIIERKGADAALMTTEGFRDVLELRREIRYDIYDVRQRFPAPLIPRPRRAEARERVLADGTVRTPLDEDHARAVLAELKAAGAVSVAVCLLHSYANPDHERRLGAIAEDVGLDVSLSVDVLPEIGEFERTATTAINAYVRPMVAAYLAALERGLAATGYARPLFLMLSGGGVVGVRAARAAPVRLAESGPVGGALAARALGAAAGVRDVLAFDMGGTTAKACLIEGGRLPVTRAYEVDRVHRFKRGSGTPLAAPTVDLIEIGAGGGSLCAVDDLGALRVGPESAGADPGPACYGRGGTRATVTDANLVLGYLDPAAFLNGALPLDRAAAEVALLRDVGEPLGLDALGAAAAVVEIVNENMAQAARMHAAERGGDVATAAMVAFGGGGPLHGVDVARRLGVAEALVPEAAGVFSALGFLTAPPAYEVARSRPVRLAEADPAALAAAFAELAAEARAVLAEAAPDAALVERRVLEMRYVGQGHQLRVEAGALDRDALAEAFAVAYRAAYGYAYDDLEPEIVTLRLLAEAALPPAPIAQGGVAAAAAQAQRPAWCARARAMVVHAVTPFSALTGRVAGPALLEQPGATVLIPAGAVAEREAGGWLRIVTGAGA